MISRRLSALSGVPSKMQSMITPKPDEALVEDAFSSYSKKVLVQQTEALSDEEEN